MPPDVKKKGLQCGRYGSCSQCCFSFEKVLERKE
jgi:hypothetical protein